MAAPAGLVIDQGIKSFAFSWSPTSLPVFLPGRLDASCQVRACAAGGCGAPSAAVQAAVNPAIGYFKASNTESGDAFGSSVALSADGSTLAVGAAAEDSAASGIDGNQADNGAVRAGAVYVFVRSAGAWRQQACIKASNPDLGDGFGTALALSADGRTLAVGSRGETSAATGIGGNAADTSAAGAGAVYIY